jgi:fibronectin-binding autotransporter adhesin
MAAGRDDVYDATGRRTFISGYGGFMRGWPMNPADFTAGTGVPKNGIQGYNKGATFQNLLGSGAGSMFYVNVGTEASATWVELTGGTVAWNGVIPANTGANAFSINDGTTNILQFDTRNTVGGVSAVTVRASPPTIVAASGTTFHNEIIAAGTVTLTGTTTVTALNGVGLYIDQPTITDASAGTVTTVSNLYVAAPAAAGGSLTITNSYAANFGGAILVSGAGTFTGNLTVQGGTVTVSAAATTIGIKAATAASLAVSDGVVSMISLDTTLTATTTPGTGGVTLTGEAMTAVSAASAFAAPTLYLAPKTNTLTGTGTTTSWLGSALYVGAQTWTDASAGTTTTVSAVHIVANAAAGGSLTITNSYMISTSVAGCFLTNAGVFTSTSTAMHKEEIEHASSQDIFAALDQIKPRKYRWKNDFVNDFGRDRYGLIAEELPDFLRTPGHDDSHGLPDGLPDGVTAAFAVAVCKRLYEENKALNARLEHLEQLLGVI